MQTVPPDPSTTAKSKTAASAATAATTTITTTPNALTKPGGSTDVAATAKRTANVNLASLVPVHQQQQACQSSKRKRLILFNAGHGTTTTHAYFHATCALGMPPVHYFQSCTPDTTKAINNNQSDEQGKSAEFETESKPKSDNHETTENASGDIPDAQN